MKYLTILGLTGWIGFAVMTYINYSVNDALRHPIKFKPVADDAAIRAAYAFAMTPEVQPTAIDAEPIVKPAAKVQQVCPCGRTGECSCKESQCACEACKADMIPKCRCFDSEQKPCTCGCNNGKACHCQDSRQENVKEKQSVFSYSIPPRLTAGVCVGGR